MIQRKAKLVSELHGALKQKCYDIFLKADRLSGCRYAPEPRRDDVRSAPRRPRATSRSEQTYAFAFQFGYSQERPPQNWLVMCPLVRPRCEEHITEFQYTSQQTVRAVSPTSERYSERRRRERRDLNTSMESVHSCASSADC